MESLIWKLRFPSMKLSMIGIAQATCIKNLDYFEYRQEQPGMFHWRRCTFIKGEAVLSKGPDSASLAAVNYGLAQLARSELRSRDAVAYLRRAMKVTETAGANDVWCVSALLYGTCLTQIGSVDEARAIGPEVWERISTIQS